MLPFEKDIHSSKRLLTFFKMFNNSFSDLLAFEITLCEVVQRNLTDPKSIIDDLGEIKKMIIDGA
jgi:hypothetical protein